MTSTLVNALNRILAWIEQYKPCYLECLQPGLSKTEINSLARQLPFQLPTEIYELYQWRNGAIEGDLVRDTAWLFGNWTFMPLQEAIEYSNKWCRSYWYAAHQMQFPVSTLTLFYSSQARCLGEVLFSEGLKNSLVILQEIESGGFSKKYASLTQMMLTIAECYETGAYYNNSQFNPYYIDIDSEREQKIWRKHNSNLIEDANRILDLALQSNKEVYEELLDSISDEMIAFGDEVTVKLLVKVLQMPTSPESDRITITCAKMEAARILGKLGNPDAVPALLAFLEDNFYYGSKVCVAQALGQLRDDRATFPLIKALTHSESEVRETAAWALGQIQDTKATKPLTDALQDSDSQVREVAKKALIQLVSSTQ
ncbi:MAG: HEAT repeat domain-containing protein [Jaaginema sp. PMC 1079.18]|nr:HEAT repeat domain-containing protein [Jaaginema sp. PMC 1080.18]MEC4853582.1 HEAT repeat domain-containing protein [Jaaginema sp. PMC 1079.18]MEC4868084.1 HEAT repeat domain-containing protein [Jaaginema sp. PMC 1078.18]